MCGSPGSRCSSRRMTWAAWPATSGSGSHNGLQH
jgi:hypothetical protein